MLNNDNRLSVFVQKFNKIQMQKRFFEELGFMHPVKRFNLSAGAHLINSKLGDYSVDLDQLHIIFIQFLKIHVKIKLLMILIKN